MLCCGPWLYDVLVSYDWMSSVVVCGRPLFRDMIHVGVPANIIY